MKQSTLVCCSLLTYCSNNKQLVFKTEWLNFTIVCAKWRAFWSPHVHVFWMFILVATRFCTFYARIATAHLYRCSLDRGSEKRIKIFKAFLLFNFMYVVSSKYGRETANGHSLSFLYQIRNTALSNESCINNA